MPKMTVVVVADEKAKLKVLVEALESYDCRIVATLNSTDTLCQQAQNHRADFIVLDKRQPSQNDLHLIARLKEETPMPVVMFCQQDQADYISQAIRAGVDSYIVDDMDADRLGSILTVAKAKFIASQSLVEEVNKMKNLLEERKVIEKAKGLIMQNQQCDESAAYQALRKLAMDRSQRIFDVAKNVISVMDLMKTA